MQQLEKLPFTLIPKYNLVWHDGPLLSHFIDETGQDYIVSWSDVDEVYHTWLIFKVSKENLLNFFHNKIDMLSLIFDPINSIVYTWSNGNKTEPDKFYVLFSKEIPEGYLFSDGFFFGDGNMFEDEVDELRAELELYFLYQKAS